MNYEPVYLWVRNQDVWDFLQNIHNSGPGEGQGERPPQADVPDDGVADDKRRGPVSEGSSRSVGPVVPVRHPREMGPAMGRTPGVPPHRVPKEPPPLG